MLKFLIFLLLAYLAYRLFAGKPLLGGQSTRQIHDQEPDDEEYVDYEEVD